MKQLVPLLLSLLMCATASASPDHERLAGVYRLTSRDSDRHIEFRLDCANESACTFTSTVESDEQSAKDVRRLKVRALVNPVVARQALEFAKDWLHRPIRDEALALTIADLRRWLRSDTEVARCWDLNHSVPEIMLVCRLANTAARPNALYLFIALPGPCDEAFCRYVIESPMRRIR